MADLNKNTLLIADDAEINRELLKIIFEDQYAILEAADGAEAISLIEEHNDKIVLVFLDLIMPIKSGLDVLEYMSEKSYIDFIPVIMITGEATAFTDEKAYELGASDIIYKPFEPTVVMRRTQNIIELFERRFNLEEQLAERTKDLLESKRIIEQNNEFLVNALSSVVEFRSLESGEHIKRVKRLTKILLECIRELYPEYGIKPEQIPLIVNASALHDLGKIAIPDSILLKPGRLTNEEYEEMKKHTIYGCQLLERFKQGDTEFYRYCYDICRYHHERYDGRGYPDQLTGEEIPIWAQVVAVVDVFDALINKRVYKQPYPVDAAVKMIEDGECGTFSPKLLECFRKARPQLVLADESVSDTIQEDLLL
jgi:putative two-component system response regulator